MFLGMGHERWRLENKKAKATWQDLAHGRFETIPIWACIDRMISLLRLLGLC